jgi:hypothetical protein
MLCLLVFNVECSEGHLYCGIFSDCTPTDAIQSERITTKIIHSTIHAVHNKQVI